MPAKKTLPVAIDTQLDLFDGKVCTGCLVYRPLAHYSFRAERAAYNARCKPCKTAETRAWRKRNPGRAVEIALFWARRNSAQKRLSDAAYRTRRREWRRAHRRLHRLDYAVYRARRVEALGKFTLADVSRQTRKQAGRCFYCSCILNDRHCDHYIPLSKGGTNYPENIVISCPACNLRKGSKMPEDFIAMLKSEQEGGVQ